MINKNDPRLTAFVLGELEPQQAEAIEAAIDASPELQSVIEDIRQTAEMLEAQFLAEPVPALTRQQREAIFMADVDSGLDRNFGEAKTQVGNRLGDVRDTKRRWLGWLLTAGVVFVLGSIVYTSVDWPGVSSSIGVVAHHQNDLSEHNYHDSNRRFAIEGNASGDEDLVPKGTSGNGQDVEANLQLEIFGGAAMDEDLALQDRRVEERDFYRLDVKTNTLVPEFEALGRELTKELAGRAIEQSRASSGGGGKALSEIEAFSFDESKTTRRDSDDLLGSLLREVDPSGTADVQIEPLGEDRIAFMVEGQKVEEISLYYLAGLDENDKELAGENALKPNLIELGKDLKLRLEQRNKILAKTKQSWKRVKATANTSRLMVGDKDELKMQGMQVNVQVDGFRARVLLDCFYYNDRVQQLEGDFKLRLPDDASLYYFAFGQSSHEYVPQGKLSQDEFVQPEKGQFVSLRAETIALDRRAAWESVKEARMVTKEKAALAYTRTVRRKVDPALVEWSGAGVFSARVFPLMPQKLHRIVIGYDVSLTKTEDGLRYRLDLPEELGQCKVDLNVAATAGTGVTISPLVKPTGDETQYLYRFSNSTLGESRSVELNVKSDGPLLLQSGGDEGVEFWTTQVTPELPSQNAAANSHGVFLLDTSLSSNPDKFNVWLRLLRETLSQNRDSMKQFSVMMFNVESYFWNDGYVDNTPENVDRLIADCQQLALEGATDVYGAIDLVASSSWLIANGNRPDLFLLSDGAATWGETNLRLLEKRLAEAGVGSLFAYQTGLTGTAVNGLRFLADRSGGAVFSVTSEAEVVRAAVAHRKRPWQIRSMKVAGGSDLMTAGRVRWVYPGQTITIVGRGNVDGALQLVFGQGTEEKVFDFAFERFLRSALATRMYGYVSVGQLESLGSQLEEVAAAYARHFRITGKTCSLLMLETEEDYQRFNIKPQEDLFVVKTRNATELVATVLKQKQAELVSPKSRLLAWYRKLEKIPGISFTIPTALGLAMEQIEVEAIAEPLVCKIRTRTDIGNPFLDQLGREQLDYSQLISESQKRGLGSSGDAIKVLSSLIERNPGDLTLTRDVAFVAMGLDEPAQAYGLLQKVVMARPFEPTIYPAIGKCLTELGAADMAILFYEVAMEAKFENRQIDFRRIVAAEYMHLLRKVEAGSLDSNIKAYASHRLGSLKKSMALGEQDLLITMMWNTDQSDVDLHVVEPSGEDCHYGLRQTRSGGRITRDITDGFGPEMYTIRDAPKGKYQIKVKFFGSNANRTKMRSKVYLAIYQNYGRENESVRFQSVELGGSGDLQEVATVGLEN